MQYMNSIASPDYVKDPECATAILDANLPNTAADICERPTVQRLFTELQQIELTADVDTDRSRKFSDDIQRVAMPVNVLKRLVRQRRSISDLVYFSSEAVPIYQCIFCPIAICENEANQVITQ